MSRMHTDVTALATLLTMVWVSVTMGAGGAAGGVGAGGAGEAVGGGGGGDVTGARPGKLLNTPGNCARMSLTSLCCSWRRSGASPGCAPPAALRCGVSDHQTSKTTSLAPAD